MITERRMDHLQISTVGSTAMHLPIGDKRMPQALASTPGTTTSSTDPQFSNQ